MVDFVAGDTVDISLSPDGTVTATHNGKALGTVRSPALVQGILLIWFGEKPADGGLKKGMLGMGENAWYAEKRRKHEAGHV
jgi:hypothetical protein